MEFADDDFSQYTESIFIPFIFKFSSKHTPQVLCTIEGIDIEMPVDTGSTGLLIGAPILPSVPSSAGIPAHHFFSSSMILYVGRLVELAVSFVGEHGSYATSTVPVLVVDRSWRCPWYDPIKDGSECPLSPTGEKPLERDTRRITYMGVGFGRNGRKDGMPYGAPQINPFLNIETIDGFPVPPESLRAGYVISTKGIQLGLTSKALQDFVFTNLEPGLTHADDPRDWAMLKTCFEFNDGVESCGEGLIDTGIAQMYIRPRDDVSIPTKLIRNPNKNGYAKLVKRVVAGTNITIGFPTLEAPAISYSFAVSDGLSHSMEPSYVVPAKPVAGPFVNTGRNFLYGYSIAFDAVGGRFGFRPNSSQSSMSVL
ncbi:hypothetical protein ACN47E_003423 [Coniothyrium glycines]